MSTHQQSPDLSRTLASVLEAVARAPGAPLGQGPWVHSRAPHVKGRSTVYFLGTATDPHRTRWVVKQSHPGWAAEDVDNPVLPDQEFAALTRLHRHFSEQEDGFRVPRPLALLPDLGALAMEYVPGVNLRTLVRNPSLRAANGAMPGLAAAAGFLRRVHALEELPTVQVDLREEAEVILALAEEKLGALGLALPASVISMLAAVPSTTLVVRRTWLHGDFCAQNIILATDGSVVGIDPSLDTIGFAEDDLVRFLVLMSATARFAPGRVLPPVATARRNLERQLLRSYYGSPVVPPLLDLRLTGMLVRRWVRLCELAAGHRHPAQRGARRLLAGAQVEQLMHESLCRLGGHAAF